jgi:hypothetical protein
LSRGRDYLNLRHSVSFCPAGGRPLGAGSPPLAARRDSSGHDPAVRPEVGPLGVRKQPRHRHPTPTPHAGDPVASGEMAAPSAGRIFSAHPKKGSHLSNRTMVNGRVGVRSAPRATGAMALERAGTERASRGGVSLAWLDTNSEGPHRGTSLLGRMRRRVGGLGSMPSPSYGSRPAGQEKSFTQ